MNTGRSVRRRGSLPGASGSPSTSGTTAYLDRDPAADRPGGDTPTRKWLPTRGRGIDSLATIGAWQAVECRLGRGPGPDGGPRPAVMAPLG